MSKLPPRPVRARARRCQPRADENHDDVADSTIALSPRAPRGLATDEGGGSEPSTDEGVLITTDGESTTGEIEPDNDSPENASDESLNAFKSTLLCFLERTEASSTDEAQ